MTRSLREFNRRVIVGELAVGWRRNARLAKDLHALAAVQLPSRRLGIAADDLAAAPLPDRLLGHVSPVGLQDHKVRPVHVRPPIRDELDQAFADRPGAGVVLTEEEADLVTGLLGAQGQVEQPVAGIADAEQPHGEAGARSTPVTVPPEGPAPPMTRLS